MALWAILALVNPTTTYHLAPPLLAAWPAISAAVDGGSRRLVVLLAASFAVIAIVQSLVLSGLDKLGGGSYLPSGGPTFEALVFAIAGGVAGAMIGIVLMNRLDDSV